MVLGIRALSFKAASSSAKSRSTPTPISIADEDESEHAAGEERDDEEERSTPTPTPTAPLSSSSSSSSAAAAGAWDGTVPPPATPLTPAPFAAFSSSPYNPPPPPPPPCTNTTTAAPSPPALTLSPPTFTPNAVRIAPPPPLTTPYTPSSALLDLPPISYALSLFVASHMLEAEEFCRTADPGMERLYFATGYGLIQCVKGLMSYADEDLLAGIAHTKQGNHIASLHRKKATVLGSRLAGYILTSLPTPLTSSSSSSSTQWIKNMSTVEKHAELVYAESLFEKAILGVVYSGDWMAFVKEALNMRTTITIYRQLGAYIEAMDAAWAAAHPSASPPPPASANGVSASSSSTGTPSSKSSASSKPSSSTPSKPTPTPISTPGIRPNEDPSIDVHFRSGVYLGVGMCNLVLSMIPGKLAVLVELFGYKGDRREGLRMLMRAGGWGEGEGEGGEPAVSAEDEGVRRTICDMCLLIFHLVLSSVTSEGVDVSVAGRVLEWNLRRYPNGVFFLFGAGRLHLIRSQPLLAIHYYTLAMRAQTQYRNLHHVSYWEIAVARLCLWDVKGSLVCWRELDRDATWSKAIYGYGMAVCLLELAAGRVGEEGDEKEKEKMREEAREMMDKVPGMRQKIAGKSIPFEKFVARKARKFTMQGNELTLPALEVAYFFLGITHAPRGVIEGKMLPEVERVVGELRALQVHASSPSAAAAGGGKDGKADGGKDVKVDEKKYRGGKGGYWDDYCLAMFLRGVCMRFLAYPDADAVLDLNEVVKIGKDEASKQAEESFKQVFEYGPNIELDHHLVYHAHYELGRLHACRGDTARARAEFELVLSGKPLEVGVSGRKVKYSMENALHMRTHAANEALGQQMGL